MAASNKSGWAVMDRGWEEVQKKTFTKWCNAHLIKRYGKDVSIEKLTEEFESGERLMQLIHCLYDIPFPTKYNKTPKMRPQKLDNIEQAFKMLDQAQVKTHFLKPVHLVDKDATMILGMIWSIILDYQIKGISVEELTAKEGLLLWCKKKTQGYKDVNVQNFTTTWKDGLAFCALIHKHRPDLLDFDTLSKSNPRENLELAFDVAEKKLGIPRLLDVEDLVDTAMPDERSIITYVSEYFHCFSAQNQFEVAGRRIAKLVGLAKTNDQLKNDYLQKAEALTHWINQTTGEMQDRSYDNTLQSVEGKWEDLKSYRKTTKPEKTNERSEVEACFNSLQAKLRVNNRPAYVPPEQLSLKNIEHLWNNLSKEENNRSDWLRKEIERQRRIENMASRFWRKATALLRWGGDNESALSSTEYGASVAAVQAKLRNHEGFEAAYNSTQKRLDATKQLGQDLINENYGKADAVQAKIGELDGMWSTLRQLADVRKAKLEEELARQQELENLRLDFATKSRALLGFVEDAEDVLAEPVLTTSVEAIQQLQAAFAAFLTDLQSQVGEYNAIEDLNNQLISQGVADNMYATHTMQQVTERWERLHKEVNERKESLDAEEQRQQENDKLCKAFADQSNAFNSWVSEEKSGISQSSGSIADQLESLRTKRDAIIANQSSLDELRSLNQQIDDRNITFNRYTEETIQTLQRTWDSLVELVSKQLSLLEKELIAQSGPKIPEEQLAEFKETFKQFDKDRTGTLERHEFKACLSALGHNVNDEQLDQLMSNLCKKTPGKLLFEEFVEYMISKTEDSDTAATIRSAFKTLAGEKDFVTEEELRRVLDKETVTYLLANMPHSDGKYNYNALIEATYKN